MTTDNTPSTIDESFASFLELDLDRPPVKELPLTPLQVALRDLAQAEDMTTLERVIAPLRTWPEGKDKQTAREALGRAQARIRAIRPPVAPGVRAAQAMELSRFTYVWISIWGSMCKAIPTVKSYKPAFQTNDTGRWYDNAQRFATQGEAEASAYARFLGWTLAKEYTSIPSLDEPNYRRASDNNGDMRDERMSDPVLLIPEVTPTVERTPIPAMPREGYPSPAYGTEQRRQEGAESPVQGLTQRLTAIVEETRATPPVVVASEPVIPTPSVRAAIQSGQFVTGARESGSGILVGWAGSGELTQAQSERALERAGYPASWGLKSRSNHAHAAAAMASIAQAGRIIKPVGKGRNSYGRFYSARWTVGNAINANVGDKFGQVILTVELSQGGTLNIEGDENLAARVREEYQRRVAGEVYPAGDVTEWFRKVLIQRFQAVRLGGNWYVPESYADGAERLCRHVADTGWGLDWILPALPVATTDQLRAGLVRGLEKEVATTLAEFETQRASARKAKAGGEIGASAAASLLNKLRDVRDRAKSYADLLGSDAVSVLRRTLQDGINVIEPLAGDSAQRFNLMELV